MFGAEVYVANLVGLGMVMEMGALMTGIYTMTRGGYGAPGQLVYFDANHKPVPGADAEGDALPALVEQILAGNYSVIGAAHSATTSYLPCFVPDRTET